MTKDVIIHWFRQDLRLSDNPALTEAAQSSTVLPIYIFEDDAIAGPDAMGAASRVWLHSSLAALNTSLGGKLALFAGDPAEILPALAKREGVHHITRNRVYEPWRRENDARLDKALTAQGVQVSEHEGSLLWAPELALKADGTPYKVFSPFYKRGCMGAPAPRLPLPAPAKLKLAKQADGALALEDLLLLPSLPWAGEMMAHWHVGEAAAQSRLHEFLEDGMGDYKKGRDFPAQQNVSRLSPHLHFGELSPNQAWYAARAVGDDRNIDHFCSELAWREFSYSLLQHNPALPRQNLNAKFDAFPWGGDEALLEKWRRGQTGIPIVDAGMRELWSTGYMHNRVRMIVASFLVKNLGQHWHHGAAWFWDCLVDADLANNSASWQWVAGCGADAAPYFRIFNPVTQSAKFDPEGDYIRTHVPELAALPTKHLFAPWEAPSLELETAGVRLGETYPEPVVDLKASRQAALDAFQSLKTQES